MLDVDFYGSLELIGYYRMLNVLELQTSKCQTMLIDDHHNNAPIVSWHTVCYFTGQRDHSSSKQKMQQAFRSPAGSTL